MVTPEAAAAAFGIVTDLEDHLHDVEMTACLISRAESTEESAPMIHAGTRIVMLARLIEEHRATLFGLLHPDPEKVAAVRAGRD
jgi:hypothetical protein